MAPRISTRGIPAPKIRTTTENSFESMKCCGGSSLLKRNYCWQKTREIEQAYIAQKAGPMHLKYDVSIVADSSISIIISALTDAKISASSNYL